MLISWLVLAIGQLSAASLPLIDVGAPASRSAATPITPGEPSTLVEAIIGVGLIAVYLVIARQVRSKREERRVSAATRADVGRKAA